MKHEIDLDNYNIRTDLVLEQLDPNTLGESNIVIEEQAGNKITTIQVDDNLSKELNKEIGTYITIEFSDITDFDNREKVGTILEKQLQKLFTSKNIPAEANCLIIGLGNEKSTADSLGPKTINNILVTRHLFIISKVKPGIRSVSALNPGVMATTGIETFDIIKGVIDKTNPNFLIVIDALAASSIDRVNKTIQITDTGIHPGSGVGNHRQELSEKTLGLPVIALGVPTVVESSVIVSNTITYLFKHLSYLKENNNLNKLIYNRTNYLEKIKTNDLTEKEKEELLGMVGTLSDEDKYRLIKEVLNSIDYNLIVTPKEIDFIIDKLSLVIANALNNSLHREITEF